MRCHLVLLAVLFLIAGLLAMIANMAYFHRVELSILSSLLSVASIICNGTSLFMRMRQQAKIRRSMVVSLSPDLHDVEEEH